MIKIGVIGLGHMGNYHASVVGSISDAQLIAVADPNENNWAKIKNDAVIKTHTCDAWLDFVDAVIIAVPTGMHYSLAKQCLEAGKHVLLEKPMTNTLEQAQDLIALAHKNNKALHIGHIERFNGAVQELKKIMSNPLLIECHRMGPFNARVSQDSVVLDLMIHDIDLIMNLVDAEVVNVSAHGTKIYSSSCDIATAQITFSNGCVATISSSRASQIKKRSMAVHQQDAFINLDFTTQDLAIYRQTSSRIDIAADQLKYRQESTVEHVFVFKDNPLRQEIIHFLTAVKNGTNLWNSDRDLKALSLTFEIESLLGLRERPINFSKQQEQSVL